MSEPKTVEQGADPTPFGRTVDREAMNRLEAEVEAKTRAAAARAAAEAENRAAVKQTEPEPGHSPETAADRLAGITDPKLKKAMAILGAHIIANPKPAPEPAPAPPAKIVQLDFWEDGRRAAPNLMFRSALFPALRFKEGRPFLKQKQLFATKGGEVYFTGEQFDQSDLDVYLEILNFARPFPLGTPVKFSAYSLLRALGRPTGGDHHKWLHSVIVRLCGGIVDMTDHKVRYGGGLINTFIKDEITKEYEITIDPRFAVLFGFGMWSTLDKAQRHELGRNQTAKVLHAYYSTHAAPGPHEYETLAEIAGLMDKNPRKVKMKIIAAHEELKRIGFLLDYEAGAKTIKVTINHTPGQTRHIVRKIVKSKGYKKEGQLR